MEALTTPQKKFALSWQDFPLFVLLLLLLQSMIIGITEVVDGLDAGLVWPLIIEAIVLAWLLSHFRVKWPVVLLISVVIGFGLVITTIGSLWDEWGELFRWITYYLSSYFRAIIHDTEYPTSGPIMYALSELLRNLWILLERLWSWMRTIPQPNQDLFTTGLIWSLLMWFSAIWVTWFSHRRNKPFVGAAPIIILIGVLRSYTNASPSIMLIALGATLALLVIVSQMNREQYWNKKNVGFSHVIQRNSIWAAVLLSVTLVLSAEVISSIDLDDLFDRFREPELSTSGEIETENPTGVNQSGEVTTIINEFRERVTGGLPNNNLIGSGPELSDQVIMHIKLEEVDSATGEFLPSQPEETYYFRSLSYEKYAHNGWSTNVTKVYGYDKSVSLIEKYTTNQKLYQLEVDYLENMGGIIHTIGELASVDTNYYVSWRTKDINGNLVDMFGAWVDGDSYRAFSITPIYTESELRESIPTYPDWIKELYLQIPGSVPERVFSLTRELTFSQATPYDKAVTLERYLRSFPYTLDLPEKPIGADIADYFLFEVKKGYCDYYASTMVIMARAAGLPARFVSGFINGPYDAEEEHFVVTADLAHSWVEIYFPEFGWIPFEPTSGRPAIGRLYDRDETPFDEMFIEDQEVEPLEEPEAETPNFYSTIIQRVILFSLILSILGIATWLFVDTRIMNRQDPVKVFAKLYHRLERVSHYLGLETPETYTPYEFSAALQKHMIHIAKYRLAKKTLKSVPKETKWLIEQAILAAYSPDPPDKISRYRAIRSWAILRWQFSFAFLIVRYAPIERRFKNFIQRQRNKSIFQQGFEGR
jgi:transglutaminase-like putative cysteine protease